MNSRVLDGVLSRRAACAALALGPLLAVARDAVPLGADSAVVGPGAAVPGADAASLGADSAVLGPEAAVPGADPAPLAADAEGALAAQLALLRRAYQTGDADLMKDFYAEDIIFLIEGAPPVIGLEAMTALGRKVLPKRSDAQMQVLRSGMDERGGMAYQLARLTVTSRDPGEHLPVVTVLLLWHRRPRGWRCIVELLLKQELTLAAHASNCRQTSPGVSPS